MNVFVIDDETLAVNRMATMLESIPGCRFIGCANSGIEAIEKVQHLNVDLILMDIHLSDINGIKLAQQIRTMPNPPAIVIVTAHPEYTLAAFSIPASGYLLKPITLERLSNVIRKAHSLMNQILHENLPMIESPTKACLCCYHQGKYDLLPIHKIYYLEAVQRYTHVFHDGGVSVTKQTLKSLLQQYPKHFMQIHRKIVINRSCLKSLQRATTKDKKYVVSLFGTHKPLSVSRRNLPMVRAYLNKIFGKTRGRRKKQS